LLTSSDIAAAILGLISAKPNWAGHAAKLLANLRPVGGVAASFFGASTLRGAIDQILTNPTARKNVRTLTLSAAEFAINSHGYACLTYETEGVRHQAFFVSIEAVSLTQPGAEQEFDSHRRYAPASREMTLNQKFFEHIAREVEKAKAFPMMPAGDGSEYDADEAQQERYERLGVRPNSQFLNAGVDNQVTWPDKERLVQFGNFQLVLMPKTKDNTPSIHIDLIANRLDEIQAMTVINRFLSVMTWRDDQFAIVQDRSSGNPVPVPVPKRDLAFSTAHAWIFDGRTPTQAEAQRALALYREARNAEDNYLVSYAVLNYYKILETNNLNRSGNPGGYSV
jgi:hypothetical protein